MLRPQPLGPRPAAWPAAGASGRGRACVPSHSVLPRVSPTLAAAEGHQSTGPSHPCRDSVSAERSARPPRLKSREARLKSRARVAGRRRGAVANVCSSGAPLAVVCSFERKGCGLRLGQQELVMACACVCVQWCLVLVPSVPGPDTWQAGSAVVGSAVAGWQTWHYAHMHMHHHWLDDACAFMHLLIRGSEPLIHVLIHTIGVD